MNSVRFLRAWLLALVVAGCLNVASAESDLGSISGFVKDPSGSVVPAAQVVVKNEATGTASHQPNESGHPPSPTFLPDCTRCGLKPRVSRDSRVQEIDSIPARPARCGSYADRWSSDGNCRSDGIGASLADGVGNPRVAGHSPTDRSAGVKRPQPGGVGGIGARRAAWQRFRPELRHEPGSVKFQRVAQPRKPHHLRRCAGSPHPFERLRYRRGGR